VKTPRQPERPAIPALGSSQEARFPIRLAKHQDISPSVCLGESPGSGGAVAAGNGGSRLAFLNDLPAAREPTHCLPEGGTGALADETASVRAAAVARAISFMQDRLAEPDTNLRVLAGQSRYSKSHFLKIFHDTTATTPHRFLTCLRMQRAKRLLDHTQLSVTEIALEVGYSSFPTFSRTFTALVGVSPTEYRHSRARLLATLYQGALAFLRHTRRPPGPTRVSGSITLPGGCSGVAFIGGFRSSTPVGRPLGGVVAFRSGRLGFECRFAPRFILAALVPLRAALGMDDNGAPSHVARIPWRGEPEIDLVLRPVAMTDPPVVIALEQLLSFYQENRTSR
jgi:AraC family transcriptional regulator